MILNRSLTIAQIAATVDYIKYTVKSIRLNMQRFGATRAPINGRDRQRMVAPDMLEALLKHQLKKPGLYLDEIAVFLYDKFEILITKSNIHYTLTITG
jgi:hypothetical protein